MVYIVDVVIMYMSRVGGNQTAENMLLQYISASGKYVFTADELAQQNFELPKMHIASDKLHVMSVPGTRRRIYIVAPLCVSEKGKRRQAVDLREDLVPAFRALERCSLVLARFASIDEQTLVQMLDVIVNTLVKSAAEKRGVSEPTPC